MQKSYRCIRWLLGDQLNENHSWFDTVDDDVLYVIAEHQQEASYTRHHVQKLCAFFAAMESFAARLKSLGHQVLHLSLDETSQYATLDELITALCNQYSASAFEYQRPDEYRLLKNFRSLAASLEIASKELDSEHFMLPFDDIEQHFNAGKHIRMESFYRKMRRQHDILMTGNEPVGGRWNFDKDNRNKLSEDDLARIPAPILFTTDVKSILARLERHGIEHFGNSKEQLPWPVTRKDSLSLMEFFCAQCLPLFGRFQDALTGKSKHSWSLFHSRLSFALNTKLLSPQEVLQCALASYQKSSDIDIAQVEGFVRQILGWREFIRGMYWVNMPDYASLNHYQADKQLPGFFWSGETRMQCLKQAIGQSLKHAYAHHIQRLMVTGNFCLLTGIDPQQVDDWYLGIYLDAIEWVELPNTRGMALFADGGLVGTKPYAAGGNYINKMSDYCGDCYYRVREKTGPKACPLNSLYWRFMQQHRNELQHNHRLRMIYGSWDRMSTQSQEEIIQQAENYLQSLEKL